MVLLYFGVHKLYNLLFKKSRPEIDPKYFFTKEFGFELLVIGFLTLAIGGILYQVRTMQLIIQYVSYVFLLLGAFMIYRGLLKMIVLD